MCWLIATAKDLDSVVFSFLYFALYFKMFYWELIFSTKTQASSSLSTDQIWQRIPQESAKENQKRQTPNTFNFGFCWLKLQGRTLSNKVMWPCSPTLVAGLSLSYAETQPFESRESAYEKVVGVVALYPSITVSPGSQFTICQYFIYCMYTDR